MFNAYYPLEAFVLVYKRGRICIMSKTDKQKYTYNGGFITESDSKKNQSDH